MTYNAQEISLQGGAPIECYEFARGPVYYRYTTAAYDVTVATKLYSAAPIRRGAIESSPERARSPITLTVPRDLAIADIYRVSPPSDVVTLTVYRYHETDVNAEVATLWIGRVVGAKWSGSKAELMCEPIYTSIARPGLRRLYQRSCPHVLYSTRCGALSGSVVVATTADTVNGSIITASALAAYANGYFSGGYVEWEVQSGVFERRMVFSHTGSEIDLSAATIALAAGGQIRVYPGCDKTLATCDSRFSNSLNYGGFPWIPEKNPFGSDPIF